MPQLKTKKHLVSCICSVQPAKSSFFATVDVVIGIGIALLLAGFLALASWKLVAYFVALGLLVWLALLVAKLSRGHSLVCALRWAMIGVFGALGGFGILG